MNFGNYAILTDVTHNFEKEPTWYWIIGAPTSRDEVEVSKILTTDRVKIELDGTQVRQMPTTLEIAMRELAVTFRGTNIPTSEKDQAPILKADAKVAEVEAVLSQMPRAMIWELWSALGDAVPGWGPRKPAAKQAPKSDQPADEAKN